MSVRLIEGLHLTAANKNALAAMHAKGWTTGKTARISYTLIPKEGCANLYLYTLSKADRDDRGRPVTRYSKGIVEII